MGLSILFWGWTAASSATPTWSRVVALLALAAWVTLLARHLLRRDRARASSAPPDEPGAP
ncbi:hypothetical protein [Streptomyces paludis]|nr:hypothetical protein [Streptomyces paludis]